MITLDVFEAIRTRRSIRLYKKKAVEKEKLTKVLDAARLAPSAANRQPWSFVVVTCNEARKSLRRAYNKDWFVSAPVIIVACVSLRKAWTRDGEDYGKVDVSIAMQNLILAAWEQGLGTCWIAAFKENEVKSALGIPKNARVIAMTPLGYPAEHKGPVKDRKPLEEIVHYERW
jgi:nitroreductase